MAVLATWTPEDALLGAVAPLALAAAAGTALVVDLDPGGPRYPSVESLADLVDRGPRRVDLVPQQQGVAVLRNGGIPPAECADVLEAFASGWPAVVYRLTASAEPPHPPRGALLVPVRVVVPGNLFPVGTTAAVRQRSAWRVTPDGPGPVLPRPRRATIAALAQGRRPPLDRWIRAWRRVWSYRWG